MKKPSKQDIEDIIKNTVPFLDKGETYAIVKTEHNPLDDGVNTKTIELPVNHTRRLRRILSKCNNMEDVVIATKRYMVDHKRKPVIPKKTI